MRRFFSLLMVDPFYGGAVFVFVSFMTISFYATEMRTSAEHLMFDLRVRVASFFTLDSPVVRYEVKQNIARKMAYKSLVNELKPLWREQPKAIIALMPEQLFDYEDRKGVKILQKYIQGKPIYLGVFGVFDLRSSPSQYRHPFHEVADQCFDAGTHREFRLEVVRFMPMATFYGENLRPTVTAMVASDFGVNLPDLDPSVGPKFLRLNYQKIPMTSDVQNRFVVLSFSQFMRRTIHHREGSHVNTPFEHEWTQESKARNLGYVQAVMLSNLLTGRGLRPLPFAANLLQCLWLCLICLVGLSKGVGQGTLYITIGMLVTFCSHVLLFVFSSVYLPIVDSFFFAFSVFCAGGIYVFEKNQRRFLVEQEKVELEQKLVLLRGNFLSWFSGNLKIHAEHLQKSIYPLENFTQEKRTKSILARAHASVDEFADYVDSIHNFATIMTKAHLVFKKEAVIFGPILDRIQSQLAVLIENNESDIQVSIEGLEYVMSDKMYFELILFNLVSNAVKYSPRERIEVKVFSQGDRWSIWVKDRGPGISHEHLKRIFEKFYRIQNNHVHTIKGSGLGLFLTKFFCDRLQIHLNVKSVEGEGSEFILNHGEM